MALRGRQGAVGRSSQQAFDLRDQDWQVGVVKAETWSWDTMMLDVGWHVLMMRKAAGKAGVVRMLLRIIPIAVEEKVVEGDRHPFVIHIR